MRPSMLDRIPVSICHGIGCGLVIAVLLGWWYGIRQPGQIAIRLQQSEIEQLSQLLEQRADLAARCVKQERLATELKNSLNEVSERIDSEADFATVLASISALSGETKVRLIDLQPQPARVESACAYLPLRCRVQSDWPGVCRFLDGLTKLKQLVRIDTIQLGMGTNDQLSPTTIDLCVLYAPPKSTLNQAKSLVTAQANAMGNKVMP